MKLDVRVGGCVALESFRLRFQQRLADYLLRQGSVAEGFGLMWEETLEEIPVDNEAQGGLYRELISWARDERLLTSSKPIRNGSPPAAQADRGELLRALRRSRLVEIVLARAERPVLEAHHGRVWDPKELAREYKLLSFAVPYVIVCHRSNGLVGSLEFQADPRFYFNFEPNPQLALGKGPIWWRAGVQEGAATQIDC